ETKPGEPTVRISQAAPVAALPSAKRGPAAPPPAAMAAPAAAGKPVTVEGRVRSYSSKDGYGFVAAKAPCAPGGADFWFPRKEVYEPHAHKMREGVLVVFEPIKWPDGKTQARNVRLL
ncbi:unnamed protein product, partial [Polarella glacialis]